MFQSDEAATMDDVFIAVAGQDDSLSVSSRVLVHMHDPFAQEEAQEQHSASRDESDAIAPPRSNNRAASAEHVLTSPPNNNTNSNPQNLAGAYTGAGQGPGGVSTPNPSGGGSSGGGGSANLQLPSQTQLQQMLSGANAATNSANANPTPPAPAAMPTAVQRDVAPPVAPVGGTSAPPLHWAVDTAPQSSHRNGPRLSIHSRSGPTISDPAISATEGVPWYGGITVGDSDSDDSNGQAGGETITGTIDWGDGNSTPFSAPVVEGGAFTLDVNHTWMETGTYTVVITADDPDGGTSQISETANVADGQLSWSTAGEAAPNTPPIWIQDTDGQPAVTAPANQTNTEGDNVSLQIQASIQNDSDTTDTDALSYAALDLPPGLSINTSSGLITGTVASGDAAEFDGTYNPTIVVSDAEGASASTSLTWTINPAPSAPVFTAPSDQTNIRGDNVSLQVNASQVDGDAISSYASNLPRGLSIDSNTGLISGTVDGSATLDTPYAVTITAVDNVTNQSSSQTFNWTINPANVAPVLTSPGDQTNSAGDDVSLSLSATDADGDNLTYTATGLPPGLSLDPINGVISGTLPNSAASNTPYNVSVTASDGMASSSQSFTWMVNAVSLQNPGEQNNLDGDSVSLQMTASDANNATLTYSASGLPPDLRIDSSTGLISGTIASNADTNSPYSATVTATDSNNDSVSQTFNWTVAALAVNNPGDQENQEGTAVSLQLSAADNEGTPTYSATGLPPGLSIDSTTGLISGTIGIGSYGSSPYQVTVTATNGSNTSSQSFVWTVTPRVALVNPGPQSNAEGDTVALQLSATSPGGAMNYSASGLPSSLSINSSTGLISGTLASGDAGNSPYTVTVTANDGTSSSSQTFTWTVAVINLASPGDQINNDGDTVSLSLTTDYQGGGILSYSATGLPAGLSIGSSTGQITGTISGTADTDSPYSVTVTVTDGTNTSSQTFNWTVNAVVSIDPIDDQSDAVGDSLSMQVSASDVNDNTLTYSATGLPSGLNIDSTTGLISGTIAVGADSGSPYAVTVTATDSTGNSASQSFNWSITHVSLVNPGTLQSVDGAVVSLQMQGGDADGDTVTYAATGLPPGLSISSSGLISGTIASNADTNSPYVVSVTASDGVNATTQTFVWVVSQVLLVAPSDQTNTEGDNVSLQLQGTASTGTLSYNASGLPPGLSLNTTTGLISGTIAAGDAANSPYTVDVSASNGTVSTSYPFTWTINPVANLTAPADQSNNEGDNISLQISATDSLNNPLTYTADGLPSGLSINSNTGLISGTLSSGDAANSPYVVMVTASDGTYSSSVLFSWTVTHTDTATLTMTSPGTQVNNAGDSVNLQISASDPDGSDFLTYSATGLPDGLAINPYNGLISGIVADDAVTAAPYSVTVTADDGNGQSVSQTFAMMVNASALAATASPISAVEGNDTGSITVATFTTPDLNAQAGDFLVTIDWGDGSMLDYGAVTGSNGSFTVTGDHTYTEYGTYTVTVTITDGVTGAKGSATTTATVAEAPLTLTGFESGDPMTIDPGGFQLAYLTDANPDASASDYTVTVNWGDGAIDTGAPMVHVLNVGPGDFLISGSHSYPNPWPQSVGPVTYSVTITVQDADGASTSTTSTIIVGNIMPNMLAQMNSWAFIDQNYYATPSDFVAGGQTGKVQINWGDGTSSLGSVNQGSGGGSGPVTFGITSSHTYAQDSLDQPNGVYTVTVTVTDEDGNTLTGMQYVSVVRPPLDMDTDNVATPPNSLSLTNAGLAVFTVPDAGDTPSEFSATINWGDNSSSNGDIEEIEPGLFEIYGSHAYASAGIYPVSIELSQDWTTGWAPVDEGDSDATAGTLPIEGPTVVPGKSIYTYFVPLYEDARPASNPWEVTSDVGPAPKILLSGTTRAPFKGKMERAMFADIQFSNSYAQVATITAEVIFRKKLLAIYQTKVNVVRVVVSTASANRNTTLIPFPDISGRGSPDIRVGPNAIYVLRHIYGSDLSKFTFTGRTLGTEDTIGARSRNMNFTTRVPVTLVAPGNAPAGVITHIQVGLIQIGWNTGFALYSGYSTRTLYIGGKLGWDVPMADWLQPQNVRKPVANHDYTGNPFTPGVGPGLGWPWYPAPTLAAWSPGNGNDSSHTITMKDRPTLLMPRYYNGIPALPLITGLQTESFKLYLSARTLDSAPQFLPYGMSGVSPQGDSSKIFYSEASTSWYVNMSATAINGIAGRITGPAMAVWVHQSGPFRPQVNVVPMNIGTQARMPRR